MGAVVAPLSACGKYALDLARCGGDCASGGNPGRQQCAGRGLLAAGTGAALEARFAQRFGVVRDAQGQVQRLVVLYLGKLGGGELNFSSDIDLVYAANSEGESDGAHVCCMRRIILRGWASSWPGCWMTSRPMVFVTAWLRLRPFGNAGRVALSFATVIMPARGP